MTEKYQPHWFYDNIYFLTECIKLALQRPIDSSEIILEGDTEILIITKIIGVQ